MVSGNKGRLYTCGNCEPIMMRFNLLHVGEHPLFWQPASLLWIIRILCVNLFGKWIFSLLFLLLLWAGLAALIFSIWSRCTASRDWDGADVKGRIALYLSIIFPHCQLPVYLSISGIVVSTIVLVIAVLLLFTKDT